MFIVEVFKFLCVVVEVLCNFICDVVEEVEVLLGVEVVVMIGLMLFGGSCVMLLMIKVEG